MKKILYFCLIAALAVMSASCEKIDPAGFGFSKDLKIKSNVIVQMGYQAVPITNGFYSKDADGTYHILLNICDPFLADNLDVERSEMGVVIAAKEKDFGKVIDMTAARHSSDFLFDVSSFDAECDNLRSNNLWGEDFLEPLEDLAYVELLPDGEFLLKRKIGDGKPYAVYYKGKLKEVVDLKSEIVKSYGCWYSAHSTSSVQNSSPANLYVVGYIPEYAEIKDVVLQYSSLLNNVRSETVILDNPRLTEINYDQNLATLKSLSLYEYGYNQFANVEGRMFTINYSLDIPLNGSVYDIEAVATVSFKGYTISNKVIATDSFKSFAKVN